MLTCFYSRNESDIKQEYVVYTVQNYFVNRGIEQLIHR